jgi:predicted cytidylate kinase
MKVFITGLTGTGKSKICKGIEKALKIKYYSSSTLFREFSGNMDDTKGYWTHKGLKFIEERKESDIDEKFDKYLLELVTNKDQFIMDSRTMPWLYTEPALRILLTAPFDVRVKRVMLRDEHTLDSARSAVSTKDNSDRVIYLNHYGFDIFKDLKPFDLVVNTQYLNEKEVLDLVLEYVKKYKGVF